MTHPFASRQLHRELRRPGVPAPVRAWVRAATGSQVVRVRRLVGASSTAVHALVLDDGRRLALRRYAWPGFLEDEPIAPRREVDAIRFASDAGLPVPVLIAADVSGADVGDGVPVLLMTLVPGAPAALPDPGAVAEVAARIHSVDARSLGHEYFKWYAGRHDWLPPGNVWARAAAVWDGPMPDVPWNLLHRDLNPGNLLWARSGAASIVDWASACRGPAGCDVAHFRRNMLDHFDRPDLADEFQRAYESITGMDHHPWFEIASVMENDLDRQSPAWLAWAEDRLRRALADLG